MATLTNTKIKDTYDGLLKTTDNDVIGASEKNITDGLGNASVLSIGTDSASFSDNVSITGSLTASNAITAGTVNVADAIIHSGDTDTKIEFLSNQIKTTLGGTLEINSTISGTIFYKDIEVNGLTIGKGSGDIATNTAVGLDALLSNTSGSGNVSVGQGSLRSNTTGSTNTAIGKDSLRSNTEGNSNTALGYFSLYSNTEGQNNTTVGHSSANSNTTGLYNTALGASALYANETSGSNTALGYHALRNTIGASNTAIGSGAGDTNTTGSNNIYIGYDAVGSAATNDNEIVIGASATGNGSNTATYGNSSIDEHHFGGSNIKFVANGNVGQMFFGTGFTSITNYGGFNDLGLWAEAGSKIYLGKRIDNLNYGTNLLIDTNAGLTEVTSGDFAVDTDTLYVDASNNRVGVGTSSPRTDINASSASGSIITLENSSTALNSGDSLGKLNFYSNDSSSSASGIKASIDAEVESGFAATSLTFSTAGYLEASVSERMRIDSSGTVSFAASSALSSAVASIGHLSSNGYMYIKGGTGGLIIGDDSTASRIQIEDNSNIRLETAGSEAMRIDSSGRVGIGTSSPNAQAKLHVVGDNGVIAAMSNDASNTNKGARYMAGAYTGNLTTFALIDGTSGNNIITIGGGTGVGEPSTEIRFNTGSAGATGSGSERMRIDSSGNVGINESNAESLLHLKGLTNQVGITLENPQSRKYQLFSNGSTGGGGASSGSFAIYDATASADRLVIDSSGNVGINCSPSDTIGYGKALDVQSATGAALYLRDSTSPTTQYGFVAYDGNDNGLKLQNENTSGYIRFNTAGSERMRITSGGLVNIGDAATSGVGRVNISANPSNNYQIEFFTSAGTSVGSITTSGGTTTNYNTSSDYRLKDDLKPIVTPLDRVDLLNPVNFAWKTDGSRVDGFLAHELAEVVPEAVTGEKDAVDEEGNPIYQGIDQSKLVPLLVGAIQELRAEIELLKNK